MARFLSPDAARRFYDRIGRIEDSQAFYEDPALDRLLRGGGFDTAARVFEFGCGTGRLAERLLAGVLPAQARYAGCDLSGRMVALCRARLERFGPRVTLWQSDGGTDFGPAGPPFDRIVTSYVLDLLAPGKIAEVLAAAHGALAPGGRFCAASIAPGQGFPAAAVSTVWGALHRLSPLLVGGCRPLALAVCFDARWRLLDVSRCAAWGVTSEVVIATPA